MGDLLLITAPTEEPITLTEAKAHLKRDDTDENTWITSTIIEARQWFENETGRQLCTATWEEAWDGFLPDINDRIHLAKPPLASVTSVTYTDENGNSQTWGASNYQVYTRSVPGRIAPAYGVSYPATRSGKEGAVVVRFVAGYGAAAAVPNLIKKVLLEFVDMKDQFRNPNITGTIISKLEFDLRTALDQYRVHVVV